jgi:hypothetical protein
MNVFRYEFKRSLKQISTYFIVFLAISVVLTQIGAKKVKSIYQEEVNFKNLESKLVKGYVSYHQYGVYGIRIKYRPAPISAIFTETTPFWNMTAFFDMGIRLYIYKEVSPDNTIAQNGFLDLSWFLRVIGSFLICIWGWKTFSDKDYLKFLISTQKKWVKTEIIMARVTIILSGIMLIYLQIIIQYLVNGFSIDAVHLGVYILVVFLVYVICLLLASLMGIESTKKKKILIAVIWILFVMLLPELVKYYFDKVARIEIGNKFVHELKKADVVMKVEKDAFKKAERFTFKEKKKKYEVNVESAYKYWNEDSKELERLEKSLIGLLKIVVKKYQFISSLTPITFLNSVALEVSSQGYRGRIEFNKHVLKKQRGFLKYIFEKLYFKAPNYGPVISFINEGENIFSYRSTLPGSFWFGVVWSLMIIFLLMWLNCRKLNNVLFRDEPEKINNMECNISEGDIKVLLTGYEPLKQHVFNYFAGKVDFKGDIVINTSKEIEGCMEFIYLYKKEKMDNQFTNNDLVKLLSEEGKEQWEIIFKYAEKYDKILILDEFFNGRNDRDTEKILEVINHNKLKSLIITSNQYFAFEIAQYKNIFIMQNDESVYLLKKLQKKLAKKG